MAHQQGQIVNQRYRIVSLLGQGGFGAVYRAWDIPLNRPCALKENLDISDEAQRQFMREATLLANLSHPNLPRVTDHFILPGQGQFLVMDFIKGEDLATMIAQRGALPAAQAVAWVCQVGEALAYLHTRQPPVIHRDVKPANIRITPDGQAMLVDFGLVKIADPGGLTALGARGVTPGYSPPEQYGRGHTDVRTDIYALGATLYTLLTGQTPSDSVDLMTGSTRPLSPAHLLNPQTPPAISAAVSRAMSSNPAHRFQSAAEFIAALTAVPEAAPQPMTVAVRAQPPTVALPAQAVAAERARRAPSNTRIFIAVGIVLVLLAGLTAFFGVGGYALWTVQKKHVQQTAVAASVTAAVQQTEVAYAATSTQQANLTGTYQAQQTATAQSHTATAEARQTATAAVYATSTARIAPTTTLLAQRTATAAARASTTAAAARATDQAMEALTGVREVTLISGPLDGSLTHVEDGYIEMETASVNLADFVVEAVFYNPYSIYTASWDYGFLFRYDFDYAHYRLAIRSTGEYSVIYRSADGEDIFVQDGSIYNLDTSASGSNHVLLVVEGTSGSLYVNRQFVTYLNFYEHSNSGDLYIATGIYTGDEINGEVTRYEDFIVWSIP